MKKTLSPSPTSIEGRGNGKEKHRSRKKDDNMGMEQRRLTVFTMAAIPGEFHWINSPMEWNYEPTKGLSILAGAKTDCFIAPGGDYAKDNAPCALVTLTDNNFLLSAKVSVAFASTFDAGVLQIRVTEEQWAKLCFEYSPQHHPMIVSVVTRGISDDCTSVQIDDSEIYLRVARTPQTLAFHYSYDGRIWQFVRNFTFGQVSSLRVGFSAQSPTGVKCAVVFSEMRYRQGSLKDNRSGE